MARTAVVLLACLVVVACSSQGGKKHQKYDKDENTTEQVLYRSAESSIRSSNYKDAITKLERLEARFPFGRYAEQAQLELIYAHYMSYESEAARSAADRFIRLHPLHPNADYAYYMKGITSFDQERGFLDRFRSADPVHRDLTHYRDAFAAFAEFLARYPQSYYASDARQRMVFLRNLLARAEIDVAQYYMRRGAYVAAANRARNVVEHFDQSQSVADALAIQIESNWRLGMTEPARDALKVLALNYPHYPAFDKEGRFLFTESALNQDRSWLNMMTWGLLDRPKVPPPILIDIPG